MIIKRFVYVCDEVGVKVVIESHYAQQFLVYADAILFVGKIKELYMGGWNAAILGKR